MATNLTSPFPATRWTRVVEACGAGTAGDQQRALADICSEYWYPLYAFARRLGKCTQDAEDLTQGFFEYLLERGTLASANPGLGRLRTFLLTVFQRYIGDEQTRDRALKRGGGQEIFSLDAEEGDRRYGAEPADEVSPEQLFDHSWAVSVLHAALEDLRKQETLSGRGAAFAVLECFLNPQSVAEGNYESAAAALETSAVTVRKMVSRLRAKFRDCLRQQIAGTLREPSEAQVDEELTALKSALRS